MRSQRSLTAASDAVQTPGLFDQAFAGVFDDLRARSAALAALPATLQATDAAGDVLTSYDGVDVLLRPTEGHGVWTVNAADLAGVQSISVDPAPSVSSPLIINVTGDGAELAATVTVEQAAADAIVWNAPTATTVTVSGSLVGSLLAPSAAVSIGADLRGSLVASSMTQTGATVTPVPFAADLPASADPPTSAADPATESTGRVAEVSPAAPLEAQDALPAVVAAAAGAEPGIGVFAVPPATGNNAVITVKVGGDRVSTSGVTPVAGVTLRR